MDPEELAAIERQVGWWQACPEVPRYDCLFCYPGTAMVAHTLEAGAFGKPESTVMFKCPTCTALREVPDEIHHGPLADVVSRWEQDRALRRLRSEAKGESLRITQNALDYVRKHMKDRLGLHVGVDRGAGRDLGVATAWKVLSWEDIQQIKKPPINVRGALPNAAYGDELDALRYAIYKATKLPGRLPSEDE